MARRADTETLARQLRSPDQQERHRATHRLGDRDPERFVDKRIAPCDQPDPELAWDGLSRLGMQSVQRSRQAALARHAQSAIDTIRKARERAGA